MPQSTSKAGYSADIAEVWDGELRGREGSLGFTRCRRASLYLLCLVAAATGASRSTLTQLLGCSGFACGFHRETFCIMGALYIVARGLPVRKPVLLVPEATEELVAMAGVLALMEADLRAGFVHLEVRKRKLSKNWEQMSQKCETSNINIL